MITIKSPKRFSLLKTFSITFLVFAFLVRLCLYILSIKFIDFSIPNILKVFGIGLCYDIGALSYPLTLYALYLLLIPVKFHGSKVDQITTKFTYGLFLFICIFSFLAEVPFWQEYQRRFNFIAVDYLLYTYEVIENIHQTFPLPLLIGVIVILLIISIRIAKIKGAYTQTFESLDSFKTKLIPSCIPSMVCIVFIFPYFIRIISNRAFYHLRL